MWMMVTRMPAPRTSALPCTLLLAVMCGEKLFGLPSEASADAHDARRDAW